jgi:microcin C transport system substrate-binding protein
MQRFFLIVTFLIASFSPPAYATEQPKGPEHGFELYGHPKYPADFKQVDYVNPNAPKGGEIRLSAVGTFDSLNPFVIKGNPAAGLYPLHPSFFYATLTDHSWDEPASTYGYIAETMEMADDQKSVTFNLRESAKFHDGSPITADDVVFSFDTLKAKGNPMYAAYYRKITSAEALGPKKVRFNFSVNDDKELPLIIGEIPIISKTYFAKHDFAKSDLTMPLGSGPYKITHVDPGKSITYTRVKDWWGENIPINKGRYNFDTIKFIYFRDSTVALEAFKAGDIDFRMESTAKSWATGYDSPALKKGDFLRKELKHSMPMGMMGFVFNIRKPLFQDINVRKALALAYDFEWANKNLFYGTYTRANSFFSNCELAATGIPTGEELKILEPFKGKIPEEVFTTEFKMPVNDNGHHIREQLKISKELLKAAGWELKGDTLVNKKTGEPFEFEFLLALPEQERVVNSFVQNLKMLGIKAKVRIVDVSQYTMRVNDFDYDMLLSGFGQSITPGNEQADFWGSKAADAKGSQNTIGIKNPVIDTLVEEIIHAQSRESLVAHVKALDRILLWNFYVVPGYYSGTHRIAYWKNFHGPDVLPKYHFDMNSWWYEAKK